MYGVWVAPPAVMMLAYSSLEQLTSFDAIQRLLFCESPAAAMLPDFRSKVRPSTHLPTLCLIQSFGLPSMQDSRTVHVLVGPFFQP